MTDDITMAGGRPVFYDRDGQPISANRFGELRRDVLYRLVARDKVGKYVVSTMWLGTDQGDDPNGPPLIFGTVLRDLSSGDIDIEAESFAATETHALENQARVVATMTVNAQRGDVGK